MYERACEPMYRRAFESGRTFDQFVAEASANRELWHAMALRALASATAIDRIRSLPGRWRLLALAEDWCGDAVNILPVVARVAEEAENLELRIIPRDGHIGLVESHLTGRSRAIPIVILLDEAGCPHGWWGPRPRQLQAWFDVEGRALPEEERYRSIRRWYARDRGVTIAKEIADLVGCGATGAEPAYRGTRPCEADQADHAA